MSLVQRDFILRMIEAVGAAVARALRRKQSGDLPGARRELHIACDEVLGPLGSLVSRVDSRTAVSLIGDGRRVSAIARLLVEDADLLRLMSRESESVVLERRALETLLEAFMRDGELDSEGKAIIALVRGRLPIESLDARYRESLSAYDTAHNGAGRAA
jgi:hypothetical protein